METIWDHKGEYKSKEMNWEGKGCSTAHGDFAEKNSTLIHKYRNANALNGFLYS